MRFQQILSLFLTFLSLLVVLNVPGTGLEPAHCEVLGSKPSMSTIPSSRHTFIFDFGTLGLEPRQTASEAVVLPLDDIPMKGTIIRRQICHKANQRRFYRLSISAKKTSEFLCGNNKLVAEDGVEPPIFGL